MRIARLELFGFKSFPDRTVFHFGPGISCVVGPNGSGKSNVVDALRWCIGEQSARSLRGAEMTDVIFAGSQDRKPVGFAEVVLAVVADDGEPFPGEYAQMRELEVGRRLHRSGTSEYLINQTRVRRRDVVELLLDSGVGNNLYAFVEQGQVDKMISATAEERRSVIDEAAGIARYKARREEAVQRLEATAAQLDRAADVVDEMGRHLAALEKQVLRTAQFRRLRALVRLGELRLALAKHAALAGDRKGLRERLERSRADEDAARREALRREEDIGERRGEIGVVQSSLAEKRDALGEIDARIREQAATAGHLEQRRSELLNEAERAVREAEAHDLRAADGAREAALAAAELAGLRGREAELASAASGRAQVLAATRERVAAERAAVMRAEEAVRAALVERIAAEGAVAAARASAIERRAAGAELERTLLRLREEIGLAATGVERATAERARIDTALAKAEDALARADAELAAAVARSDAAEVLARRAEGERDAWAARGRRWLTAAAEVAEQDARALTVGWDQRLAAEDDRLRRAAERARADVGATAQAEHEAAERTDRARVAEVEAALRMAEERVGDARTEVDEARAELGRRTVEREAVAGELATVRATLEPADELLRAVLGEVVPLVRAVPEGDRDAVARRLGDRAGLAVVRTREAVLALADALPEGRSVAIVYWPEGSGVPGARTKEVRTLADALGGKGPSVGPGFRIDADGVVTLGNASGVERSVARERALTELWPRLEADVAEDRRRLEAAETALAGAIAERDARASVLAVARSDLTRQSDARLAAGRARVTAAEADARARGEAELRALRERRDGELAAARELRALALAELAEEVERVLVGASPEAVRASASEARTVADRGREARERALEARAERLRVRDAAAAAVAAAEREAEALRREAAAREAEIHRAEAAAEEAERAAGAGEVRRAAAATAEEEHGRTLDERRASLAEQELEERAALERASAAELERATVAERVTAAMERGGSATRRAEEAARSATTARESVVRLRAAAETAEAGRVEALAARTKLVDERGAAWDALERERVRAGRLDEALKAAEDALRDVRTRSAELARRTEGIGAELAAVQSEIEVLRRGIEDRYQLSLPAMLDRLHARGEVVLDVDPDVRAGFAMGERSVPGVEPVVLRPGDLSDEERVLEAVADLDALRAELAGLGEVNLGATAEYDELKRRHAELEAQRADLEQSVQGIRAAIAKLNRMCRERFRETFDRVNENLQEVYPKLVGGGSARLSLTDDEDLLETGVDIFVQPPGKRLQNLQLLSGGEKAMTAIALIIALFRVKPAPFCVLDEVDAPLDEANGARFNDMLKEMSRRSQFLVITHNRKTMECADTLYGVTMARPGVSRLVSVDLSTY